ncbi:cytochrome bd oxidase small subunit CydS [Peribacillus sp. NPDC006672]
MHHFLITYAPLLAVAASIAGVFIWGTKSKFLEKQDF